ncbi:MAG: leucine--tRNA ligase [Nanoarchaeota archaeon]|nr:leucine--tRNA ligase [Nanoarchaeota archaeon]MBU1644637.1 leucine--tRNA ligase [Nanoarchaeota archaeon]MBU1976876.1 leucine--tRNA ligase [Nanoarchaeota archaeon]
MALDWHEIQEHWQEEWAKAKLGQAVVDENKEKFFMIFAYPGISGFLHVGHMRGFSYTDAICRFERLKGKTVLFPVGTHATGNQAISFAEKVKNKDEDWINYLVNNGCPKNKVKELTDPKNVIEFFNNIYINDYWKKFGFLCDWDRFLCTTHKDYEKFIQWQFRKLQQKNLLVQKPYFATSCISCGPVAVDPSETDISKGGNAEKNEYTLLKFKIDDDYLVAATLRPETIYGQTNLWINPEGKYLRVEVEGENWILSEDAAEKLKYQKDDVILKEDIDPTELIGKSAVAPGIEKKIIILPASFVDPKIGSGVVTCVPSDAPYDYVALKILQENKEISKKYGRLDLEKIKSIKLIPIITTKGYGEFPAKEIVEKMKINSLDDPRLEEATKEIYKAGFHSGIMKDSCGKFSGKRVEEAKEMMKAELLESGKADLFYDLSEEVICRCGKPVVIKRIDDQWFIKYSDPELTERSKEQVKRMNIYPAEYKENMPSILDWFGERACARLGNWQGSKFPFDDRWTIEPISDSTLYPAFYIVSKYVNNKSLTVEDLTTEFFDYVYLGKTEDKNKITEIWKTVRKEFEYFYPLDLNLGGKEHKTVHFPVFLMNHVAILPEDRWPKGIFVNWWVTGKGGKISKSKGGAEPIPDAIEKYGVDAMRLYYAHIGSPHVDVVWDEPVVINYKNALERIHALAEELKKLDRNKKSIDRWIISRLNEHLNSVNRSMERYDLRELASIVYYSIYEDMRWYVRRGGSNKKTITEVLDLWVKLMNPITPHLSEEVNDSKKLVSASSWPKVNSEKIDRKAEASEQLVRTTMEGMRTVLKLSKLDKAARFTIFVSEEWKYELFNLLSHEIKVTRNVGEIMKKVLKLEHLKIKGKEISKLIPSIVKDVSKLPEFVTSLEEELESMEEAKNFLEKEFGCEVKIYSADKRDNLKAKSATPGKVGILVE